MKIRREQKSARVARQNNDPFHVSTARRTRDDHVLVAAQTSSLGQWERASAPAWSRAPSPPPRTPCSAGQLPRRRRPWQTIRNLGPRYASARALHDARCAAA
ncbi:unnamed protein product [Ixodes pacificus]